MEDNRAIDSLPEQAKTEPNTTTVDPDIDDAPDPEEEDLDDLDGGIISLHLYTNLIYKCCEVHY